MNSSRTGIAQPSELQLWQMIDVLAGGTDNDAGFKATSLNFGRSTWVTLMQAVTLKMESTPPEVMSCSSGVDPSIRAKVVRSPNASVGISSGISGS